MSKITPTYINIHKLFKPVKLIGLQEVSFNLFISQLYILFNYNKGEIDMDSANSDWEKFWDAQTFAIITDRTKPAMKWAVSELKKRGKKIYLVDLSEKPDPDSLIGVDALPSDIDRVVIGITKTDPGDIIPLLKKKGVKKIWLHWNTDTEKAVDTCQKLGLKCMTGHCPMMYLGSGLSIHGIHRRIAKMTGKY